MNLIHIAALVAVCSAAKLDRTYLPPASSKTAGGSGDLLVPHFRDYFEPGQSGLPKGAEENEFDGVVVEAAAAGTRATGSGESGLGGSRVSYGSTHSKVGEAAFRMKQQQRPVGNTEGQAGHFDSQNSQNIHHETSFGSYRPRPSVDQSDSQASPNFHQAVPTEFNRPGPSVDQQNSQALPNTHQGAPSEFNRPGPSVDQSDSQASPNFHQAVPTEFNRPGPSVDQPDSQALPNTHQGAPSEFNRPGPSLDQSNSQALPNTHQGGPSEFIRPGPSVDQSNSQALPNIHQGPSSEFYRPRPAADQTESQDPHSFHQGPLSHLNRPRPAADKSYLPPPQNFHQGTQSNSNRFRPVAEQSGSQTSQSFHKGTTSNFFGKRPQSSLERTSNTVRFENNLGSQAYNYAYETENGITAQERGVSMNGVRAEGGFSYTGDDGKLYKITYTAGEGGYQPIGDHLPTPPPIPHEILKSLEENAKEDAEGSDDDGSYDAAKYNAEDDYTKSDSSNSRQPAFGKKPEPDVNVSGTFINQNDGPLDSFSNNNRKEQSYQNAYSKPHSIENNPTNQNGLKSNDGIPVLNAEQQSYATSRFGPTQNKQSEHDGTITQPGLTNSDNNVGLNKHSDEFGSDDFSRPINLSSTQFSQVSAHRLNERPNLPTTKHFTQNQVSGINSDTIQAELSPHQKHEGLSFSSNFDAKNINQQKDQDDSQILSHDTKHTTDFDKNLNIHSTLQPSLELSTPYEYFSNPNQEKNFDYPNQSGSPRPTQQLPFLTRPTLDSQTNVMANGEFITSNADADLKLHNSNSQQDSGSSQRLPSAEEHNFNVNPVNSPKQDQPYYYNQPSVIFNPYIRPTIPTFASKPSENGFGSIVSTKYPSPPTIASSFPTMLPGRKMYDQNPNIPQSYLTQNSRLSSTGRYPQLPSLGHIIIAPTSPTTQNDENIFNQHTGITQASVSSFPSISPPNYNLNYNSQQTGLTDPKFYPNSQSNKIQGGINDKQESIDAHAHHVPNLNMLGEQTRPGQQYDGEVYEYKKPTESLVTPTESDELIEQNGFSQFGQKLKPSTTQANTNFNQKLNQNEYDINQGHQYSQGPPSLIGTRPESQNFQPRPNSQMVSESNNGGFNNNKINRQPIGHALPTSGSQFSSGAFNAVQPTAAYNGQFTVTSESNNEGVSKDKIKGQPIEHVLPTLSSRFSSGAFNQVQTTADYNGPFGFSSRIRPCCQGSRKTSTSKTPDHPAGNNFQSSAPFGNQNTNLRPEIGSGNLFSTQSSGHPKDLQNAQSTSQSLFSAKEDEFDGTRKPPSFDEVSGYHY